MLATSSPFSFILFGASGHLAKLKVYPALYVLALKKRLPTKYVIAGFARSPLDDDSFRTLVEKSITTNIPEVNQKVLTEFLTHCFYHQGEYLNEKNFHTLSTRLENMEKGWKDPVRIAYFSVPPEVFPAVSHNLCSGNVHSAQTPLRCIVEKPVGHDLASFEVTHKQLIGCFQENDIYLLDHYLGKEAVRNVYYLRYANPVLERLFKNTLIHHVEITANEHSGLEGRAGYFENTGTFRDMFQSHLLEISALLTMRLQDEEGIRASRLNALEQFYLPPGTDLNDLVLQGQYAEGEINDQHVPAYREEEDIPEKSRTNTFAAFKIMSRISRWQGVPFYLRSGKRIGTQKETRISIQFQEPQPIGKGATPNRLDIILQGEAGMRLHLQTKVGGTEPAFRPLILEDPLVCVGDCLPEHGLLLLEAIHGKQQWYLTFDEVRTAWRLVDPLQVHLDKSDTPLHPYTAGSKGPIEMDEWIGKDGRQWL